MSSEAGYDWVGAAGVCLGCGLGYIDQFHAGANRALREMEKSGEITVCA
jgi:hypothetical protein